MNLSETVVAFNPEPTTIRLQQAKWVLVWRLISAALGLAFCFGIKYLFGEQISQDVIWLGHDLMWWIFATWGASTVFWLTLSLVRLCRAHWDLQRIAPEVPALVLSAAGIRINGRDVPWPGVSRIWAKPALSRTGAMLVVQTHDGGREKIPFSFLAVSPATVDSALRARGQVPLDFASLDRLL